MVNFRFQKVSRDDPRMEDIYRLRYQVYCTECGFEAAEDHPGEIEFDEYDEHSSHFCATVVETEKIIGTVRIIRHSAALGLPIQHLAPDHKFVRLEASGEISRLAISKEFRRREIDKAIYSQKDIDLRKIKEVHHERRKFESFIVAGLYQCIYHESLNLGLSCWYAVMVKGLAGLLRRWGIWWESVGPEIEYHGLRGPYMTNIADVERQVNPFLLEKPTGWDALPVYGSPDVSAE